MSAPANFPPFSASKTNQPGTTTTVGALPGIPLFRDADEAGGARFYPRASTPTPPTQPPFATAIVVTPQPGGAAAATVEEAIVGPIPKGTSSVGIIRALTLMLKFSIGGGILLGGGYLTMHSVVPVIKELRNPGGTNALQDKNASPLVKAIQQTRVVVDKNNANVAYLDSLVGTTPADRAAALSTPAAPSPGAMAPRSKPAVDDGEAEAAPAKAPASEPAPAPAQSAPVAAAKGAQAVSTLGSGITLLRASENAVADLKIDGVVGGASPRIMVNGLLVRVGEMADRRRGLRFTGVDANRHVIFFTNEDREVFERRY